MNERMRVASLTRMAFLNAIIISFLSMQFVMPAAFVLLLALVPVIFALAFAEVSAVTATLSSFALILISSLLFGLDVGLWTLVYGLVGLVLGMSWRLHLPWGLRLAGTSLAFATGLAAAVALFAWISRVSWQDVGNLLSRVDIRGFVPLLPAAAVGLTAWSVAMAATADRILGRVLRQSLVEAN